MVWIFRTCTQRTCCKKTTNIPSGHHSGHYALLVAGTNYQYFVHNYYSVKEFSVKMNFFFFTMLRTCGVHLEDAKLQTEKASFLSRDSNQRPSCSEATVLPQGHPPYRSFNVNLFIVCLQFHPLRHLSSGFSYCYILGTSRQEANFHFSPSICLMLQKSVAVSVMMWLNSDWCM